ncbi:hypothetical protein EV424DRAFT_1547437 [Suillus variegatus]|nr:hypothetical protein EV424DRAFT_1547437 [Suillus variegatus]
MASHIHDDQSDALALALAVVVSIPSLILGLRSGRFLKGITGISETNHWISVCPFQWHRAAAYLSTIEGLADCVLVSSKAQRSNPIWDNMRFEGVIISSHVLPLAVFTHSRTESPSALATLGVQLLSPALGVRLFTMGLQILGHLCLAGTIVSCSQCCYISPFLLGYHLLIVQAVGAASAANMKTSASTSANIMLGGIAAQLYG